MFPSQDTALAALREIAQALSAALDLDSTLDLIAHKTTHVMGVNSCSIYLLDPNGDRLILRASTGLSKRAVGQAFLHLGEGLTGWSAMHAQPVGIREARLDPRFKFLPSTEEELFASLLAVPFLSQSRVIGAMNVQTKEPHDFSPSEAELLSLIGDLAAGALDRAILYDNMNRQLAELTTLAQVSQAVTSPLYLDEILGLVTEMAAKVMGAEVCSLQLVDENRGELVTHSSHGGVDAYRRSNRLKFGEGIAGRVAAEGRPIVVEDVRSDPRYLNAEMARAAGLVSLLSVPLTVREKIIGVLNCYTARPRRFSDDEVALFSTLANQTALAIENAQLATNAAIVREMHHRIKNNLQTVALLMRMQLSGSHELTARDVLHESINRIMSIASVHEVLAEQGYRLVNVKEVLERIAHAMHQSMVPPGKAIAIRIEGDPIVLPSRPATSLSLVVNELLQNALEHAFVGRETGEVGVRLGQDERHFIVEVTDDGIGMAPTPSSSLGLEIVENLIRDDLKGNFRLIEAAPGTQIVIRLPRTLEALEVE